MSDDRRKQSVERMKSMTAKEISAISKKAKQKGLMSKFKDKIKDFKELLGAYGLIYVPKNSKQGNHRGRVNGVQYSPRESFQENYRVQPTPAPRRTHEDMVVEHMAHDAYMSLVDGKGDHDCDCK